MKFPTPEEIAKMKACGYDNATVQAAELQLERGTMAQAVCEKIREAFAGVQLGSGVGLQQGRGLDDCQSEETCASLRVADEKDDWQSIPSDRLNAFNSSLSFFDAEGMRFHLPAYLIADLKGEYHFGMAFTLTEPSDYSRGKFELLSPAQRLAVRDYLHFIFEDRDYEFRRPEIEKALSGYWNDATTSEGD